MRLLCWLCLIAATNLVYAAAPAPIPELTGLLVDEDAALSEAEQEFLAERLRAIQTSGRAQVAIFISSGTGGEPLAEYAVRVAEKWQRDRAGRDDGLLVLVIPSANAARIEVGDGLKGAIPDARASQWLDELLPAVKNKELAGGLGHLLDQIEGELPAAAADARKENYLFPDHPEWRVPFVLVVFSPFAIFPLFFGRWGSVASGPLLACFMGGAAWIFWNSQTAGLIAAAIALPLPFLWGLNWFEDEDLARWLRHGKVFGNLIAVAMFFSVITLFVGAGVSAMDVGAVWIAPLFAGLLATGLAVFLFPGKPARYLGYVLTSAMLFVFILIVAWTALGSFAAHAGEIAFTIAGVVTACAALGLYLDRHGQVRLSRWCYGVAVLVMLPLGLLALVLSVVGG